MQNLQDSQRSIFIFFICFVQLIKYGISQAEVGLYSRRYENIDVDTILQSPRLVTNYVDCLLSKRSCPPEGKELKRILPEALKTKCSRCWPSQKESALKIITKLYFDYPQHYEALRKKWDPTGEYNRRFEEYLKDQKFNFIIGDDEKVEGNTIITQTTQKPSRIPDVSITTPPSLASRQSEATQRSTRQQIAPTQQSLPSQPDLFISNRFGNDASEFDDMKMKAQPQRTPAPTMKPTPKPSKKPATMRPPQQKVSGSANVNIFKTQNPIINLLNRLTTKFATTAEIIAGVLRGKNTNFQFNNNNMGMMMMGNGD